MTYGPVDFLAFEFENKKLKGEILPALIDLIDKKLIRVIDLVVVQKDKDGHHEALELQQLDSKSMALYDPLHAEVSGIIQVEDVDEIAGMMKNNTTAAALLIENLWAVKFKEAVMKADGRLLEQVRIPHEDVQEAMEKIAAAEDKSKSAPK